MADGLNSLELQQATSLQTPEQRAEAALQKVIQARIEQAIRDVGASNLPSHLKEKFIQELRDARGGTQTSQIERILENVIREVREDEAKVVQETGMRASLAVASIYPEYDDYSHEGRNYLQARFKEAVAHLPELQQLHKVFEAAPVPLRELALSEQQQNRKAIKEMLADPQYEAYKEQLQLMRGFGLGSSEHGRTLVNMMRDGVSPEEVQKALDQAIQQRIDMADGVVQSHVNHIPKPSQDYLREHFSHGGKLDTQALLKDWAKIDHKTRDEAYKAFANAGEDLSKLTPQQQHIIHLSQVMVAADVAAVEQGAVAIMKRDAGIAKILTDQSISSAEREQKLEEALRNAGITKTDKDVYRVAIRQTIKAIDETEEKGVTYSLERFDQFSAALAGNYQENLLEAIKRTPVATQADVRRIDNQIDASYGNISYRENMYFIAQAKSPDPVKDAEWQAIEDKLALAYTPEAQAAGSLSKNPPQPLTAVEKAKAEAELAANPMKAFIDAEEAKKRLAETGKTNEAVPAEPMAAAPTLTPPAGIDPKDIPALKGVSSFALVADGEPPTGHVVANSKAIVVDGTVQGH